MQKLLFLIGFTASIVCSTGWAIGGASAPGVPGPPMAASASQQPVAGDGVPELSTKSIFAGITLLVGGGLLAIEWNRRRRK